MESRTALRREAGAMVELPTGTARGICDCSHRWSRHDLARTDGGGWALACHDCGRPCVALSKGAAAVYSAPDFGRLLNEHPELDLYRDSRVEQRLHPAGRGTVAISGTELDSDDGPTFGPRSLRSVSAERRRTQALALRPASLGERLARLVNSVRVRFGLDG